MTLDDHIRELWSKEFEGCDIGESNYRQYSLAWYKRGVETGIKLGQQMRGEAIDLTQIKREKQIRDAGYAQGIAYAAWIAACAQYDLRDGLSVHQAARIAQDAVLTALRAAEEIARERVG